MCGILGLFDPSGVAAELPAFDRALGRLQRRGPDDVGAWRDGVVRLGHRRLAIVDLSAAGHQPMESHDRRYVIVFNGEIYNHQELRRHLPPVAWRGTSDTETLLEAYRAWGPECLQRLNGMFAFAIWDRTERRLFLARDRMGVKPIYYGTRAGAFAFGSRPGAVNCLLEFDDLNVDPEALRAYLELGYIPNPLSFHRGLRKLPPAHCLHVSAAGARLERYWDYRPIAPDAAFARRSEEDLAEELLELIRTAVRDRLMSDVPLGAFLSGGVDSALVVAAMKAAGVERPRTFTIAFDDQEFDEGPAAARAAELLGVEHTQERLDVDSLLALLPTYIEEYDEPFADSSAFPTMAVARLARRHVTVALTGDGADELFGGYHYYPLINWLSSTTRWRPAKKKLIARVAAKIPLHRAKLFAGAMRTDDTVSLFHYLRSVGKDFPSLVSPDVLRGSEGSDTWFAQFAADFAVDLTGAETGMRLDAGFTLPELFLQKVDVATMAFSLEARCPMTDYRLVEWAMRLPLEFKLRDGQTKYLLKKALCRHLPASHVFRKKMGFGVPIAAWLRGPLRDWASELLHDERLLSRLPLERDAIRRLFDQHQRAERESHPLLWSVLMLLCFVRKFDADQARPALAYREVA